MILEGIIATVDEAGQPHLSAMGPEVDADITRFELRPFPSSQTCQNLRRTGQAVFHVTDDVELLATIVAGESRLNEKFERARSIDGFVLASACRAYELKVIREDFSGPRGMMFCQVLDVHRFRDFFGFNRAKHAVVEAAILVTRIDFLPQSEIETKWQWLSSLVDKTGGPAERKAMDLLTAVVARTYSAMAR